MTLLHVSPTPRMRSSPHLLHALATAPNDFWSMQLCDCDDGAGNQGNIE